MACVAPALRLRHTCVQPAWPACNLRGLRGACVSTCVQAACNLRGLRGASVAPASRLRRTCVGKTKEFSFFFSTWNNEIVKTAENAKKNRKTIVVFFCGLHFVSKKSGKFCPHAQKNSSAQIQQSRGLTFHPEGQPQKRVAMAHLRFQKLHNKHRRHRTPQLQSFFGLEGVAWGRPGKGFGHFVDDFGGKTDVLEPCNSGKP